jgi:hypothetical protein
MAPSPTSNPGHHDKSNRMQTCLSDACALETLLEERDIPIGPMSDTAPNVRPMVRGELTCVLIMPNAEPVGLMFGAPKVTQFVVLNMTSSIASAGPSRKWNDEIHRHDQSAPSPRLLDPVFVLCRRSRPRAVLRRRAVSTSSSIRGFARRWFDRSSEHIGFTLKSSGHHSGAWLIVLLDQFEERCPGRVPQHRIPGESYDNQQDECDCGECSLSVAWTPYSRAEINRVR